tara:strand:- start:11654 stop:12361 length:708 start_codon:yes stop_codon:yes gene_type:complete
MLANNMQKQIDASNIEVVKLDKTKKEIDGQYAKLVNSFETEKSIKKSLEKSNRGLYKTLKKKDEKILMLNDAVISLKAEISSGNVSIDKNDTNSIVLNLRYPEADSSFINWDGTITLDTKKYLGEWTFKNLPIQIVLTETKRGLWNSRFIGPNWLTVDSMEIKSLPAAKIAAVDKELKLGFILGGGYLNNMESGGSNGLFISGGIYYKNEMLLLNAATNNTVGLGFYHKFSPIKK